MTKMYHFLRLIRLVNILVIALTMIIIQFFLSKYLTYETSSYSLDSSNYYIEIFKQIFSPRFIALLISTLLIAAAGNIINDYFDVKADRINKPKRLIIGIHIKRRWAMVWHWSFNSVGLCIALYLGYILQNIWIPIVAFVSINLLWFYSIYFKRKAFIGNIFVALLLGFIPFYILIFNYGQNLYEILTDSLEFNHLGSHYYFETIILFTSIIAFLLNLIRELVKDIMDIRGDLKLGAKTFPIKYGIKKSKWLIAGISVFVFTALIIYGLYIINSGLIGLFQNTKQNLIEPMSIYLLFTVILLYLVTLIIFLVKHKHSNYKMVSNLLKLIMLIGLIIPLFL